MAPPRLRVHALVRLWPAAVVVAAMIAAVVVGIGLRGPSGVADAGGELHPAWGADPSGGEIGHTAPTLVAELPDVAWDLEYSPATDEVWFVSGTGDTAKLFRLESGKVQLASDLPAGEYSGVHHRVRAIDDGAAIILNADYAMIRFAPSNGAIETASLPVEVKDALPGALDPGTPLPGTWVSAFDVANGNVYVARNNVPYLTVLDSASLETRATIPIPQAYAGARGVVASAGDLYVLTAGGTVGQFQVDGTLVGEHPLEATGLVRSGNSVRAATRLGVVDLGDADRVMPEASIGFDPVISGIGDGGFAVYDWQSGWIEVLDNGGGLRREIVLPQIDVAARNEDYRVGATAPASLSDLVVATDGTIWFARADSRTLWSIPGS